MANYNNGMNRKNKDIFLSEEARIKYGELVKSGVRMALMVENLILSTYEEKYKKDLNEFYKKNSEEISKNN